MFTSSFDRQTCFSGTINRQAEDILSRYPDICVKLTTQDVIIGDQFELSRKIDSEALNDFLQAL